MAMVNGSTHETKASMKHIRTAAVPITSLAGRLPTANIPDDTDLATVASQQLQHLETLGVEDLHRDAFWRDSFALTGTLRTFYTPSLIVPAWQATFARHNPKGFVITPKTARIIRHSPEVAYVQAHFTFRTTHGDPLRICSGFLSMVPDDNGGWKIWMIRTILENFEGLSSPDVLEPGVDGEVSSASHTNGTLSNTQFDCVVVGGGQSGLGVGGRLQALGVSYMILDKHTNVGDSWRVRYDSVKLHTAREYGHLPFERMFGPEYPEFLTKDHLADAYKRWVAKYHINIWQSTELLSSSWDDLKETWTCRIVRDGEEQTLTTSHLVFATGAGSQEPVMPQYLGREKFKGTVLHSSEYKNAASWKGKNGIVVGSANTGHDVAEDMLDAGLSSVTMVQRGKTYVLPAEYYMNVTTPLYNDQIPTELSDRSSFSMPIPANRLVAMTHLHRMARADIERFQALERAGFKVEPFGDMSEHQYVRLGGHYMDVGCSAKIARGLIKMKSDALATHYTKDALAFDDGTEIKADVIVFTTGFTGNLREMVGKIVGPEIQEQLEDFCGVDKEGEVIGAFKPTGHPGIWYIGGAIGQARYWSRFIALQVQAAVLGKRLEVYSATPNISETVVHGPTQNGINGQYHQSNGVGVI